MSALRSTAISDPFNAMGMHTRYPTETSTHLVFAEHTEPEALLSSSHTPFVWCPLKPRKENLFNQCFCFGFHLLFSDTVSPEHVNANAEDNLKPNRSGCIMISKPPYYSFCSFPWDHRYTLFKCSNLNQNRYLNGISKPWKRKKGNSEHMKIFCNHKANSAN